MTDSLSKVISLGRSSTRTAAGSRASVACITSTSVVSSSIANLTRASRSSGMGSNRRHSSPTPASIA
ncbi:hypothetical protein [Kibdelosporangium philippinense]|uniref:hypothetical protein n=1 Tax=Kibdelosporangium philippinense TaxID=211113 RepID=UPI003621BD50